jgi:hypothetical protein
MNNFDQIVLRRRSASTKVRSTIAFPGLLELCGMSMKASSDIVTVRGSFVVLYIGNVLVANLPTTVTVALHSLAYLGFVACH